jgi:hypothetical protein
MQTQSSLLLKFTAVIVVIWVHPIPLLPPENTNTLKVQKTMQSSLLLKIYLLLGPYLVYLL